MKKTEPILSAPEAQKPPPAEPMSQESISERVAMASERQDAICVKSRFSPNGNFALSVFDSLSEMYNAGYVKGFLAASTAPGWISVKERLPEDCRWCWVVIDGVVQRTVARIVYYREQRFWQWAEMEAEHAHYSALETVSVWQPLPAAPPAPPQGDVK